MSDIEYDVVVNLVSRGDLTLPPGAVGRIGESGGKAGKSWSEKFLDGIGAGTATLNSKFDSIAGSAISAGAAAATAFAAAAAGGLGYAVKAAFDFNEQVESSTIALGAIANANGLSNGIADGMNKAGDIIKEMRKDAASLPGEFKDLEHIMTDIASAGAQIGLGFGAMEKMAAKTMTAGAILGIRPDVAGREMAMMLEGHARATEPLFRKLGLGDARSFNKLNSSERLAKINGSLDALSPAAEKYQNSWQGIKTTSVDAVRQFAGRAGAPLFDTAKSMLQGFNLRSMAGKFDNVADMIGDKLNRAFINAVEGVKHWYPVVFKFVHNLSEELDNMWGRLAPTIKKAFGALEKFMSNPESITKLEHIAKDLVMLRVGSGALGMGASIGKGIGGLAMGAEALAGGGAAGASVAAVALPVAAVVALAGIGIASALADTSSGLHDFVGTSLKDINTIFGSIWVDLKDLGGRLKPLAELLGAGLLALVEAVAGATAGLLKGVNKGLDMIEGIGAYIGNKLAGKATEVGDEPIMLPEHNMDIMMLKAMNAPAEREKDRKPEIPKTNVHIANVNIRVNSNQDPNRIAKKTATILMDYAKSPRAASITGNQPLSR